jgi:hypothetical protein
VTKRNAWLAVGLVVGLGLATWWAASKRDEQAELPPVSAATLGRDSLKAQDLPVRPVDPLEILLPHSPQLYYQYVDENGGVRFTQNPHEVPEGWRGRAGRVELDVAPPDTPAAARLVRKLRAAPEVGNEDF